MKNLKLFVTLFIITNTFGALPAVSDPWVDEVILFDQPAGSSNEGFGVEQALGEPQQSDGEFVSIDIPETAIFAFTDNLVVDGSGNDLKLYEFINGDSDVEVSVSPDNINYTFLGITNGTIEYDLAQFGLSSIRYVKIVGLQDGGGAAGYDLDAIEALNSKDVEAVSCEEVIDTRSCAQNPATEHWVSFAYRCDVPEGWVLSETAGEECDVDDIGMCPIPTYENGQLYIPKVNVKVSDPFGGIVEVVYEAEMSLLPGSSPFLFQLDSAVRK